MSELAPLLDHIRQHLFDPAFNIDHLERALRIEPAQRRSFRQEFGCGLKAYLLQLKRQTAEWLLENTDLPIRQIAVSLNYSRDHNFSRDFRRWTGLSAAQYRLQHRDVENSDLRSVETRWKATVGCLEPKTMRRFVADLERRFPPPEKASEASRAEATVVFRGQIEGEEQAKIVWRILQGEPPATWDHLLRQEIHFGSPALFELLSNESREQGRRDRQRGVELAKLALASVEGSAGVLGERFHDLIALAWIRLGHAHRLASDFVAAEQTFRHATTTCEAMIASNPRAEAELCLYEGSLRLFQRRYDDALVLLSRCLVIGESLDDQRLSIDSLLQRAAVSGHQGYSERSLKDLNHAMRLAESLSDPRLLLFVHHDLAKANVDACNLMEAEENLSRAKMLHGGQDDSQRYHQLRWVEGQLRLAQGRLDLAEDLWREAQAGFRRGGDFAQTAEVSMELAILCHGLNRNSEAIELLALNVIPTFEQLRVHREALGALRLLREAVAANEVSLPLLKRARNCLHRLCQQAKLPQHEEEMEGRISSGPLQA